MSVLAAQAKPGASRDDWQTPEVVLERVRRLGPIALDPCTTVENPVGAKVTCHPPQNGLAPLFSWAGVMRDLGETGLIYVNPPYSRGNLGPFTARCRAEALAGAEVVALVPAATSELWFQDACAPRRAAAVCFWRGRLKFVVPGYGDEPAPFSSAVVYWGRHRHRFAAAFDDVGAIWM